MTKVLFVGNFLSRSRGTKGAVERIFARKEEFEETLLLSSSYENRIVRFLDILYSVLFKNYDLVIIDVYSGLYFYMVTVAVTLAGFRKKKVVLNLRGGMLFEVCEHKRNLFNYLATRSAQMITPSLFLKECLDGYKYKVRYLPNFLDITRFSYAPYSRSNSLLWVRAFTSIYQPEMAIRTLSHVKKVVPDATLTMVGPDLGELSNCLKLIDTLNLRHVVNIVGKISNEELPRFYQTHRVFLNTTSYESFGVAVLEAASCGIPVVSNRVGEIPYIWKENEEMLLCNPGDDQEMADKVVRLLLNPDQAASLSLRARKKAEQFSWEAVKPQWKKLLQGHE